MQNLCLVVINVLYAGEQFESPLGFALAEHELYLHLGILGRGRMNLSCNLQNLFRFIMFFYVKIV